MKKKIITILSIIIVLVIIGTITILNMKKTEYEFIGGVIRNNGNGWCLISDEGHCPVNINSVVNSTDVITIYYPLYLKVITFSATVDETMAKEGYAVGASVGFDHADIYIYDSENKLVNPNDYIDKHGNIWIYGLFVKSK